jgi:hypothetical protein
MIIFLLPSIGKVLIINEFVDNGILRERGSVLIEYLFCMRLGVTPFCLLILKNHDVAETETVWSQVT